MLDWNDSVWNRKEVEAVCKSSGSLLKRLNKQTSDYDWKVCETINAVATKVNAKKILDAACGVGFPHGGCLAEKGHEVYGVDISEFAIQNCKKLYPQIKGYVGCIDNLPFKDGCFDIVYCFNSFWYFPNVERALDEMIRVTRPEGYLFFDILNMVNLTIRGEFLIEKYLYTPLRAILKLFPPARTIYKKVFGREFIVMDWRHIFPRIKPTHPGSLYDYFDKKKGIKFGVLSRSELMQGFEFKKPTNNYQHEGRLIFQLSKRQY